MTSNEEELMAQLLSAWLDDLRHDREPRRNPIVERLSPEKATEVMELARWYKSILYPSSGPATNLDALATNVGERVSRTRRSEAKSVAEIVDAAMSFAEILRNAAAYLDIDLANLEHACGLERMELLHVAAGTQPAHHVAVEAMVRVFRGLRLPNAAVDALRLSSLEWERSHEAASEVRLNRARTIGSEPTSDDNQEGTGAAVESYCTALRERLQ